MDYVSVSSADKGIIIVRVGLMFVGNHNFTDSWGRNFVENLDSNLIMIVTAQV